MLGLLIPFIVFSVLIVIAQVTLVPFFIALVFYFLILRRFNFSKIIQLSIFTLIFMVGVGGLSYYYFIYVPQLPETVASCQRKWKNNLLGFNDCIKYLAYDKNDITICDSSLPNKGGGNIGVCYSSVGERKGETTICETVQSGENKDKCYRGVAEKKRDVLICDSILNYKLKNSCINNVKHLKQMSEITR